MVECPKLTLNTGAQMPVVGLGTWKSEPGQAGAGVRMALEAGYRHIDCAAIYGNETDVRTIRYHDAVLSQKSMQRASVSPSSKPPLFKR
eukprot:5571341-Pyramimonas_sp.AAC.1